MAKRTKVQKNKQRFIKHTHKTTDRVTRTPLKTGGELRFSERVSSSCSTSDSRRVNLVTNPMISHERRKDREVLTTSGTYPWSFMTHIFHNGQPYQRCELESRRWRTNTKQNVSSKYNYNTVTFVYRHCYYFFNPRILNTQMKWKRFIQRNQFWNLQNTCNLDECFFPTVTAPLV